MKILLVEDHRDTRSTLERVLARWGHDVSAAENLEAGLGLLQRVRFDAIVSDIVLPDGTGYALMNEARRAGNKALGVAISGYPYPPDIYEAKVTGFDHHLNKPFTTQQLRRLLEKDENAPEPGGTLVG